MYLQLQNLCINKRFPSPRTKTERWSKVCRVIPSLKIMSLCTPAPPSSAASPSARAPSSAVMSGSRTACPKAAASCRVPAKPSPVKSSLARRNSIDLTGGNDLSLPLDGRGKDGFVHDRSLRFFSGGFFCRARRHATLLS